jgi:hypothetical protein
MKTTAPLRRAKQNMPADQIASDISPAIRTYLVRVELRTTADPDYEALRKEMKARGFSPAIQDVHDKTHQLPKTEFTIRTKQDGAAVLSQAVDAAKGTGCRYSVLLLAYEDAWIAGLAAKTRKR